MNKSNIHGAGAQRGVGLIEVLIALVILAVGSLAIIGMQITGKQANYDAVQRTTASHLAADMVARIRANGSGTGAYLTGNLIDGTATPSAPSPACTKAASCSATQMAAADIYDWQRQMRGLAETRTVASTTTAAGGLVTPLACLIGPFGGGTGLYELAIVWRGTQAVSSTALGNTYCGGGLDGTDRFGSDAAPTNDEYRRVVVIQFYLTV